MPNLQPTDLKRIKLTLARSKEFPEGSREYGYEFIAPLDANDRIDVGAWKKMRALCTVRHFAAGKDDEIGMLTHQPGGREHAQWVFDYDFAKTDDDETGFLFGSHHFRTGEYVSVRNAGGKLATFAVASVEPIS